MWYKKTIEDIIIRSVVVEADSFEEAEKLFDDGDWFDEDCGVKGEPMYFVAETEEDADNDEWEMIEED